MENSTQRWTTIILLIGEASGVFAGFCPSWFTVASPFFHEQEAKSGNIKRIRAGEVAATAIVLATGAAVSASMNDHVPLVAAGHIYAVVVCGAGCHLSKPAQEGANTPTRPGGARVA